MQLTGLGYVGVNATDPSSWRSYAAEILGLVEASDPGHADVRFRMDEREWRIAIHAGERDGLAYVGWEIAGAAEFAAAVDELEAAGVAVAVDRGDKAAERRVRELAAFDAPGGHHFELAHGSAYEGHFASPLGVRFRTGVLGMGHIVLTVPDADFAEAMAFYQDVLGFRVSEYLDFPPVEGALMHCGPRHHALGAVRAGRRPGCDHLMIECEDPDDVGRCWDRVLRAGVEVRRMIGRHSDDHMFSFYVGTPSRFGIEYGAGGRLIDPDTWTTETLTSPESGDVWGHQPPTVLGDLVQAGSRRGSR